MFLFDIRILITPLISSNSSQKVCCRICFHRTIYGRRPWYVTFIIPYSTPLWCKASDIVPVFQTTHMKMNDIHLVFHSVMIKLFIFKAIFMLYTLHFLIFVCLGFSYVVLFHPYVNVVVVSCILRLVSLYQAYKMEYIYSRKRHTFVFLEPMTQFW
jgi:hypothetical protein